jgi:hypothetical protein
MQVESHRQAKPDTLTLAYLNLLAILYIAIRIVCTHDLPYTCSVICQPVIIIFTYTSQNYKNKFTNEMVYARNKIYIVKEYQLGNTSTILYKDTYRELIIVQQRNRP